MTAIFFRFYDTSETGSSVSVELDLYLNDSANQLETLNRYPLFKQVFIAKYTHCPAFKCTGEKIV